MRSHRTLLVPLLLVLGCQDKKPDQPTVAPGVSAESIAGTPVTGSISGKPFSPDEVVLEGKTLSFRKGKDIFADMEIKFDLPAAAGGKLEGVEWSLGNGKFLDPMVSLSHRDGKGIPNGEIVGPEDYTMTLKVTKQTSKSVEGKIDLRVTKPANTHLTGTFTAAVKKTLDDPLDADDAPFVQGGITIVGPWPEANLSAGFLGKEADGKDRSNMAGTKVTPDGGGSATSLTFKPQLTSMFGGKNGLGYRHTKVPPGDYVVYVRRDDILAAWKAVTVKAGDQQTIDLTIDPSKTGEVVVTLPDEEANDANEWSLSLVPAEVDRPGIGYHYAFNVAKVKKGQKTAEAKGVPAGKYKAVRGKSSAPVEVVAGKSTAVTLVREEPK